VQAASISANATGIRSLVMIISIKKVDFFSLKNQETFGGLSKEYIRE